MKGKATVLAVVTLAASLAAQQPPTFRSAVNVVTLDVRVVDEQGHFVGTLTPDDLQIFEDGREQAILNFSLVNIPVRAEHADERPLFDGHPVDADVASNISRESGGNAAGRLYVLVLDDLRTNAGRSANVRAQARDFVEHHFSEVDRAVVLTTSGRMKVAQEFTNNREHLLAAIDKFEGGFDARTHCGQIGLADGTTMDTAACACADDRTGFQSLSAVARWLVPVNGQRKALLLFGDGLASGQAPAPGEPSATSVGTADPDLLAWKLSDPGIRATCDGVGADRAEAAGNAARANMTVYPVDPRHNVDALFSQIVGDTSSYYLLGYVPTNEKHDGSFRKVEVKARRPGYRVQARSGYTAIRDTPAANATSALPAALKDLMATPVPTSGLAMNVAAPVYWGNGAKASVELIVDVSGTDLAVSSDQSGGKGSLELLAAVADASGKVLTTERGTLDMNLGARTRQEVAEHGLRVLSRLDVPPGRYLLRVAGIDGSGSSKGSVQYDLDVPDLSKEPLTMSGLTIAVAADRDRPTTGSDRSWRERFDDPPTAARVFRETDDLLVSGEVYLNDRQAGDVETTTTVQTASGEEVFRRRVTLVDGTSGSPVVFRHQSTIHLQDLDPGDYLLTVMAAASNRTAGALKRQVPFTVR